MTHYNIIIFSWRRRLYRLGRVRTVLGVDIRRRTEPEAPQCHWYSSCRRCGVRTLERDIRTFHRREHHHLMDRPRPLRTVDRLRPTHVTH